LKHCIASGYPFIFGFSVYESFESDEVANTGVMPMPGRHESMLGGHAVMGVGYNDDEKMFYVRNSWGEKWGIKGYFKMPYAFISDTDLADDFWTGKFIA
jgi:C1A family cysteine protease